MTWKTGVYKCCGGKMTCANNDLARRVDDFISLLKTDEQKAKLELWTWIADLEETNELLKLRIKERASEMKFHFRSD